MDKFILTISVILIVLAAVFGFTKINLMTEENNRYMRVINYGAEENKFVKNNNIIDLQDEWGIETLYN